MNYSRDLKFGIILILISFFPIIPSFFNGGSLPPVTDNQIKVMTYNLHFGQNIDGQYDLSKLVEFIQQEKPNVVGFQEVTYYSSFNGYALMYSQLKMFMDDLGYKYSYYPSQSNYYSLANVLFSQYEILEAKTIDLKPIVTWQRMALDVLISINNYEARFFITHLTHIPGFGNSGDDRIAQIHQLMLEIESYIPSDTNIILMGDFNIVEIYEDELVPEYLRIVITLKDAWQNASVQISDYNGFTSPADNPTKIIDYIFISPHMMVPQCEVITTLVSDHLPIICAIELS